MIAAYCENCDYRSEPMEGIEELKASIKEEGGNLEFGNNICPNCGKNSLRIERMSGEMEDNKGKAIGMEDMEEIEQ